MNYVGVAAAVLAVGLFATAHCGQNSVGDKSREFSEHALVAVDRLHGEAVVCSLIVIACETECTCKTGEYWGAPGEQPALVAKSLRLRIGAALPLVPLSAYGDLAYPHTVSVHHRGDTCFCEIRGSDAGGAYKASIGFVKAYVLSRRVVDLELPDSLWEETKYVSFAGR